VSSSLIILIVVAVLLIAALVIGFLAQRYRQAKRHRHLRDCFGPEYDRLLAATGSASATERELEMRERRAARFKIRALTRDEQERFLKTWQQVQAEFVDNPKSSLAHADDMLGEVMDARGYPVQDFEQRAADLSVDHPVVVQHYYAAHAIALRHKKGEASTEELRQAMIHYRALSEYLVSDGEPSAPIPDSVPHAAE
jgi:hypothetical protein